MLDSIRGRLLSKDPGLAVVEAGGIGFAVQVPLSTYERLPSAGSETSLRLHLVVREDEWRLFGFADEDERLLFRACLRVSGVGPATALALLSGMTAKDLRAAVSSGDVRALTSVKGVGKKTAERLVVELRDTWDPGVGPGVGPGAAAGTHPAAPSGPLADATAALVALGLSPEEAGERLRRVPAAAETSVSDLVRRALRGAPGR